MVPLFAVAVSRARAITSVPVADPECVELLMVPTTV
jgi:hypothetical protein